MSFRSLMQKFGAWTTVIKWHEPWMYRVRLKGDLAARLAWAFAIGSLPTTLLLFLFAINVKPPHPLFAFIGMLLFGGMAFAFLVNGRRTARGRVRLCEEGIIRRRMYAGLSSQWVEEWSWPYSQIPQCAIISGDTIDKPFSLLLLTDGSQVELIGVPASVNIEQVGQMLTVQGVVVRRDVRLPAQFVQPIGLPIPLVAGVFGCFLMLGGLGFYALKTAGRQGDVAAREERNMPEPALTAPADGSLPMHVPPPGVAEPPLEPPAQDPVSSVAESTTPPVNDNETTSVPVPSISAVNSAPQTPSTIVSNSATQPLPSVTPSATTASPNLPDTSSPATAATQKTDLLGGPGGVPFEIVPPSHVPIVGFRYRMGSWGGKAAVAKWEPLSDRDARARFDQLVVAREGFVVGGIQVDADELVEAIRVVFVKQADDGTMDKTDYYFSDWIGQSTGRPVKMLGKGNIPVIGVYGRRGLVIDAVGLVLAQ